MGKCTKDGWCAGRGIVCVVSSCVEIQIKWHLHPVAGLLWVTSCPSMPLLTGSWLKQRYVLHNVWNMSLSVVRVDNSITRAC
jgi:hypothetical protein